MPQEVYERPIFVTAPARSGTSMVAGLLARHGVWVGTSSKTGQANAKGWFENDLFLKHTRDSIGPQGPVPPGWHDQWLDLMRQDGWQGQRWLVKAMPWAWQYLRMFNPVVVLCWRPATQIVRSHDAVGWCEGNQHHRRILTHWDMMRDLRFNADCVDVPTDRLVRGDLEQTRDAFAHIGITLDDRLARQWIEPSLWTCG